MRSEDTQFFIFGTTLLIVWQGRASKKEGKRKSYFTPSTHAKNEVLREEKDLALTQQSAHYRITRDPPERLTQPRSLVSMIPWYDPYHNS